MTIRNCTRTLLALAAVAMIGFVTTSANADIVTDGGFENASGTGSNGNLTTLADWTEEDAPNVFVDNNGTTWVPEASRTLYFNAVTAAVNQDLGHNWTSGDSYTLGLIAMNPRWSSGTTELKVQLRQADETVLWDSGDLDVTGTVTTTAPATYTGTGHIFSWTIDASTFAGAGVVENSELNVRIAAVSGFVYADNVSLEVSAVPEPGSLALFGLGSVMMLVRRRRG